MIDKRIILSDETGQEAEMEILLTFEGPNGINYVLIQSPDPADDTVLAYRYDDDGSLEPVDTEEEMSMCDEVLQAYLEAE